MAGLLIRVAWSPKIHRIRVMTLPPMVVVEVVVADVLFAR
jgi:hypothetical protein